MRVMSILALAASLTLPALAAAQDTRAEEIAAKQKQKAAALKPYQPTGFEKIMGRLEESFANPPSGFYPAFGGIYPGAGLSLGVGYRKFYARNAVWDIHGLYSLKSYKKIEFGTSTPWGGAGRYSYGVKGGWLDAPQVAFYGLGMGDSPGRANFHLTQTYAEFNAGLRPGRWTRLHGEVGYDDYETKAGRGRAPSIETVYNAFTAPGLRAAPTFLRVEGTAAIDWRPSAAYATRGGYYGATLANYSDTDDTYSFKRLDAELIQHLPLLYGNWVLSGRARVQTILDDDDLVPHFLLPQLGSGSTLRGYPTGRFTDRHSLLTSAEFRWIPNRLGLDMAIFYDAGKVTSDRGDLDFKSLKTDWGFGLRFHSPVATALRIEAAKGDQGWRLIFTTGAPF
jgi:hypothetical protein